MSEAAEVVPIEARPKADAGVSGAVRKAAGVVPRAAANGRRSKPNFAADTTTERSEGVVEAAGVEPASESASSWDSTCVSASVFSCPA
jgi:hypothetical protein